MDKFGQDMRDGVDRTVTLTFPLSPRFLLKDIFPDLDLTGSQSNPLPVKAPRRAPNQQNRAVVECVSI